MTTVFVDVMSGVVVRHGRRCVYDRGAKNGSLPLDRGRSTFSNSVRELIDEIKR